MYSLNFGKPILIAEIGGNHNGSLALAKDLMCSAHENGADIVKFQSYSGDGLVNKKLRSERYNHFKKLMLTDEEWVELAEFSKKQNIPFSSSVWDLHYFKLLDKYISIYKVGSGDLNNFHLLEAFIKTKKPLIISTAMSNYKMIKRVFDFIQKTDPSLIKNNNLGILQCSAIYDDPSLKHVHLKSMMNLMKKFPCKIGFSNHAVGINASIAALTLGAEILEFHYTFDKTNSSYRDHKLSFDQYDLKLVSSFRNQIKDILGNEGKEILPQESQHIKEFRRGVYLSRSIEKGETIAEKDLIFLRPEQGISMWDPYKDLIGKKAKKSINSLDPLDFNYFE
jgi:N-acetylneuraminate synthase/N,N'-diacetyllegionaminate synthase